MQYNFIYMYVYMSKQYIGCIYVCMLKKQTLVHSTCVCLDNSVHYTVICIWKKIYSLYFKIQLYYICTCTMFLNTHVFFIWVRVLLIPFCSHGIHENLNLWKVSH